jgi:hypothetical protein
MSLLPRSMRTTTYPSIMKATPTLLIRTSHLHNSSIALQKSAPKAMPHKLLATRILGQQRTQQIHTLTLVAKNLCKSPVRSRTPQGFLARRVREQQRIHQMYIKQAYDQELDRLARSTILRWDSSWSGWFFRNVIQVSVGLGIWYCVTEIWGKAPQEMDQGKDELGKL